MNKLYLFNRFDERFFDNVELAVTGTRPWVDFDSKEVLGTKVEVLITQDRNQYPASKDTRTNMFEKFEVKVPIVDINLQPSATVRLVDPEAVVYGEFRDKLSVKAAEIKVIKNGAHN